MDAIEKNVRTRAEEYAYASKFNDFGLIHYKDCAKIMVSFMGKELREGAIVLRLKELASRVESLQNFANIYPLSSDQSLELMNSQNEINLLIKKL